MISSQAPWSAQNVPIPGTDPLLLFPHPLFKVIFLIFAIILRRSFQSFFPSRSRPPPKTILTDWLDQGQETTTKLALESNPLSPTTLISFLPSTLPSRPPSTLPTYPPTTLPTLPPTTMPTFPSSTQLTLTSRPTPYPLLSHANLDQDPGVGAFSQTEMTQMATIG